MESNKVTLESKNDKYKVLINGIEVKNITNISIIKYSSNKTSIKIEFDGELETKEQ